MSKEGQSRHITKRHAKVTEFASSCHKKLNNDELINISFVPMIRVTGITMLTGYNKLPKGWCTSKYHIILDSSSLGGNFMWPLWVSIVIHTHGWLEWW